MKHCKYSKRAYLNGEMVSHLCLMSKVVLELNFDFCDSCDFNSNKDQKQKEQVKKILGGML